MQKADTLYVNLEDIDGSAFDDILVWHLADEPHKRRRWQRYLESQGGFDSLGGGAGNDTYLVGASDHVYEDPGNGFDEV